ncbi:glycosyltransferase [Gorillibacterium sp. CAU 1737]|uniref:glycosyltransferase n=1 Tax=Gorillibacterium sp. CAU 1737 TaxID=3140362 RepID=UPI003261CCD7
MDLVFVLYNSSKWIDRCLQALLQLEGSRDELSLIFVDNGSTDDSVDRLMGYKEKALGAGFRNYLVHEGKENVGFGNANNVGARLGQSPYILFLNMDTEIYPDAVNVLTKEIGSSPPSIAAWELRQFPYEHPKVYDPLTGETDWTSGAAFLVRRDVFEQVQGFDKHIFMYAEDVDLSWRIRLQGYKIRYVPKACIIHHSYEGTTVKPNQYINSLLNNLLLRYKFGNAKHILFGNLKYLYAIRSCKDSRIRRSLILNYLKVFYRVWPFLSFRLFHSKRNKEFRPVFHNWDYSLSREGAFYTASRAISTSTVSILIRTCNRPHLLREALTSVRNQTYSNLDVVVMEDGPPVSWEMIQNEFHDMSIQYYATGDKVGRSHAANLALDKAKGKYITFLDDDDLLYADHIETLLNEIEEGHHSVVYTNAFEVPTAFNGEQKVEKGYSIIYNQPFNRVKLFYQNYLPIQAVMVRKDELEGIRFDPHLDVLEDWDFWIQVALRAPFHYVKKTTSLYRVPADRTLYRSRQVGLEAALKAVRIKQEGYVLSISAREISENVEELLSLTRFARLKRKLPHLYRIYHKVKNGGLFRNG